MRIFVAICGIFITVCLLIIGGLFLKGVGTASEMADQTIFNADKHVYSYEEFHRQFNQYEQYRLQLEGAVSAKSEMEERGVTSGQVYDNTITEITGIRNMMRRIAANYNSMSRISYQGVWKESGLPEKLGVK